MKVKNSTNLKLKKAYLQINLIGVQEINDFLNGINFTRSM